MAAVNYYLGLKTNDSFEIAKVQDGTATVGTAADVELRIQINDGSNATNITREDVLSRLDLLAAFIAGGGHNGLGANLPAL
jgi:hypothetical protein